MKVYRIIPEFRILRLTFHRKSVSLKMLNSAGNNSISDLVSVYLKVFDHLTWNFLIIWRHNSKF